MRTAIRSRAGVATLFVLCALGLAHSAAQAQTLGPADGHDLPRAELERVAMGDEAPNFTLLDYDGEAVDLSGYRGVKDVVLVFYRGHW
ncbi:MAG: redoxin domain-containing protein [Gemmatimonadetes bacterium]|nr:redoxin domain-containing protein [Gemmatimonadota bacterium]